MVVEDADKDWITIRMVGGSVFLLVPAHPGSPRQRAVKWLLCCCVWNRAGHYIFALWFLSSFFLFSSPNLSSRRLDVYHTSTHDVALVRIRMHV